MPATATDPEIQRIQDETRKLIQLHPTPLRRTMASLAHRQRILAALREAAARGMTVKEIKTITKISASSTSHTIKDLVALGKAEKKGFGVYRIVPENNK